jgi:hypothetical protein
MKKLSEQEIKDKIISYLSKKNIHVITKNGNNLAWNYKTLYSDFEITLYLTKKSYKYY